MFKFLYIFQNNNPNVPASIQNSRNIPQTFILQAERERFFSNFSRFAQRFPRAKVFLLGASALFFFEAFQATYRKSQKEAEIQFKKQQLSKPVFDLTSTDNGTAIPWSSRNINEWLYRPVKITGRPIHRLAMMIPRKSYGLHGYEYVVPFVTKENEDGSIQQGVLLSKGFIPHEYANIAHRYKIENSDEQTFTAYVSDLADLSEHGAFSNGNAWDQARNKWSYADLQDMAKTTGFVNQKEASVACLVSVDLNTPLDERAPDHLDLSCDYREDYPYRESRAGALQSNMMPWNYDRNRRLYASLGIITAITSTLMFIAK